MKKGQLIQSKGVKRRPVCSMLFTLSGYFGVSGIPETPKCSQKETGESAEP